MSGEENLIEWVYRAIKAHGGKATILQIAKYIWKNHEEDLRSSDELFYKWQYRMRWAGQKLQMQKRIRKTKKDGLGIWVIVS